MNVVNRDHASAASDPPATPRPVEPFRMPTSPPPRPLIMACRSSCDHASQLYSPMSMLVPSTAQRGDDDVGQLASRLALRRELRRGSVVDAGEDIHGLTVGDVHDDVAAALVRTVRAFEGRVALNRRHGFDLLGGGGLGPVP